MPLVSRSSLGYWTRTNNTSVTTWAVWSAYSATSSSWPGWFTIRIAPVIDPETARQAWASDDVARPRPAPVALHFGHRSPDAELAARNRAAAQRRARDLLMSFLNDAQRVEYEEYKQITVVGKQAVYRIKHGRIANIEVLHPGGRIQHRLCIHPADPSLPVEDFLAAQLLHLRNDEEALIARANIHRA